MGYEKYLHFFLIKVDKTGVHVLMKVVVHWLECKKNKLLGLIGLKINT